MLLNRVLIAHIYLRRAS